MLNFWFWQKRIISKLNTLIAKEIKYRQTILELIQDEEMKSFLIESLETLGYIQSIVIKNPRNDKNYPNFQIYRENFRKNHQLPHQNLNLKHNNLLSNLDKIYSNKTKYSN